MHLQKLGEVYGLLHKKCVNHRIVYSNHNYYEAANKSPYVQSCCGLYCRLQMHLKPSIINREIFVYENNHVLKIRVNKFSRVPHKSILA